MLFKRRSGIERKPDIIQIWSPVICLARCYGIIPLKKRDREPYFERCSGSFVWSLMATTIYLFILIVSILVFKDSLSLSSKVIVESSHNIIYYGHCETTLLFFLFRSGDVIRLFHHWIETERFFSRIQIRLGRVTKAQIWFFCVVTFIMSTVDYTTYVVNAVTRVNCMVDNFILSAEYTSYRYLKETFQFRAIFSQS